MFTPLDRSIYESQVGSKLFGKDECPFCQKDALTDQIIWEGKYWMILHNLYPYSGDSDHIMTVPLRHLNYAVDLSPDELIELAEVYGRVREFFGDKPYFSSTRETFGNRSIEHYHTHFIPGVLEGKYLRKMLEGQGFPIKEIL